jgi:ppGpp synthetase/RelA/SpoT-type nucleotidyltranferase
MSVSGTEGIWRRYAEEFSAWKRVGEFVRDKLAKEAADRGLPCSVISRPKDVDSLVLKVLDPRRSIDEVHDKAGVRATVEYPGDLDALCDILRDPKLFDLRKEDNKAHRLGDDKIGYLGIHFDIVLSVEDWSACGEESVLEGEPWCEVQVHTGSQTLFADASHALLYKTALDAPVDIRRAINRLSVLSEIFDHELGRARDAILNQPDYPIAALMFELERLFLRLTGLQGDAEVTRTLVEALAPLYGDVSVQRIQARLERFVSTKEPDLQWLYRRHRERPADALVLQPGSLMVFERLNEDRFALKDRWLEAGFPIVVLETLAASYGLPITS